MLVLLFTGKILSCIVNLDSLNKVKIVFYIRILVYYTLNQ